MSIVNKDSDSPIPARYRWIGYIAERFGIPTGILVVFGLAVWVVLSWLASHAIEPLVNSHIALTNKIIETQQTDCDNRTQTWKAIGGLRDIAEQTRKDHNVQLEKLDRIDKRIPCKE